MACGNFLACLKKHPALQERYTYFGNTMNTIFGPINSRRFGSSLGIDLSPSAKQCNFDCLYCVLAPMATVDTQTEVVSVQTIINELKTHLNDKIDVITLTANGEPTLYPHLAELIDAIDKIKNKIQTLILTNSATLVDKKVFNTLLKLDQVKLSLDAISSDVFKKIDRPHANIKINEVVQKVKEFSKIYKGKLFIEILFVHGLNDTEEEIQKLNNVLLTLDCTRVDLGTIDRPPAYPVVGISYKELHDISLMFDSSLPIHIASRMHAEPNNSHYENEDILNTLDKRPLTMDDINLLFDDESKISLEKLIKDEKIVKKTVGNLEFLVPHANIKRKYIK
jgi:wyosine [tRNA(Phe)-imidazoG37] synthetase (radical SAM superfamily)